MFTGIIEGVGQVKSVERSEEGARLAVRTDLDLSGADVGDSMAVNGCCLTIISRLGDTFWVDVSAESLDVTTLGELGPGDPVNLERPLQLGQRVGGHLVQGHVDGKGMVTELKTRGSGCEVEIQLPLALMRYVVAKGSVAIDGVSLTVNACDTDRFRVMIIPHTQLATTFAQMKVGSLVNVELDILGKYVERLGFLDSATYHERGNIAEAFLKHHGF